MTMRVVRSFRLRIALLVTCLAGAVLVAFASWTWATIRQASISQLDDEVGRLAHSHLGDLGRSPDWERLSASLSMALGGDSASPVALVATGLNGEVLYRSATWPEGFSVEESGTASGGRLAGPEARPFAPRGPRHPPWQGPPPRDGRRHGGPDGPGQPPPPARAGFSNWSEDGRSWRVGSLAFPHCELALALDMSAYNARQRQMAMRVFGVMALGLAFIAAGGYLVAQRALQPIRALGETAERVTARGLEERIPLDDEDVEFQRVIALFNGMMERLERSFHQATRFSADAAHELKTPLAILQGTLEDGIQHAVAGSVEQKRCGDLLEEVQRLKVIIRKLLLLSLVDAGQLQLSFKEVDLSAMVEEVCEDMGLLSRRRKIAKQVETAVRVDADPHLLRQVVWNLASNAAKYSERDGTIWLVLKQTKGHVKLTVANTGAGIPESDRDKVFERFFRVDKARSRRKGGAGLGLSLSREIARAHGGELSLDAAKPGITPFSLVLPKRQERRKTQKHRG